MDDEEEQKEYGFSSKKAVIALSGNILKEKAKDEVLFLSLKVNQASKFKQIQDFKIRVLDFIAIYIKEMTKGNGE